MKEISGLFDIRSDQDSTRYIVTFKPDVPQQWSLHPDGFRAELNTDQVQDLFRGHHREPHLAEARYEGFVQFHGTISQEDYEKHAGLTGRGTTL